MRLPGQNETQSALFTTHVCSLCDSMACCKIQTPFMTSCSALRSKLPFVIPATIFSRIYAKW